MTAAMDDIRIVQAILRLWDPIGVEPGVAAPIDEYDSYAPDIVSKVRNGCTIEALARHLEYLGCEVVGLGPSSETSRAYSATFAAQIVNALRPSN